MENLSKPKTTWHGDLNWSYKTVKKNEFISRMSRNNLLSDKTFWQTRIPSVEHALSRSILFYLDTLHCYTEHGLFLNIFEMAPTFTSRLACLGRHPSMFERFLTCLAIYWPFLSKKLQKMQNLSKRRCFQMGLFGLLMCFQIFVHSF